jgi:hypothetical protein
MSLPQWHNFTFLMMLLPALMTPSPQLYVAHPPLMAR